MNISGDCCAEPLLWRLNAGDADEFWMISGRLDYYTCAWSIIRRHHRCGWKAWHHPLARVRMEEGELGEDQDNGVLVDLSVALPHTSNQSSCFSSSLHGRDVCSSTRPRTHRPSQYSHWKVSATVANVWMGGAMDACVDRHECLCLNV